MNHLLRLVATALIALPLAAPARADDAAAERLGARAMAAWRSKGKEVAVKIAKRALAQGTSARALEVLVLEDLDKQALFEDFKPTDEKQQALLEVLRAMNDAALDDHLSQLRQVDPKSPLLALLAERVSGSVSQLLSPAAPTCTPEAQAAYARAEAAFGSAKHDVALAAYDEALAACPEQTTWWTYSGDALLALGREHDALDRYAHALALDPCMHVAHRFTADVLARTSDLTGDDPRRALSHATMAIACNPAYSTGWTTFDALWTAAGGVTTPVAWADTDPAALQAIRTREATFTEVTPWYARVRAVEELLTERGDGTSGPLFAVLAQAKARGMLPEAVGFETLDAHIAPEYAQLRYLMLENLTQWVLSAHTAQR